MSYMGSNKMNLNDEVFVHLKSSYEGFIVSDSVKGEIRPK